MKSDMDPFLWNRQNEPEALAELDQRCFRKCWKLQEYIDLSRKKPFRGWFLEHSEKGPCAFLVFFLIPPEVQILRMGVHPEFRREGLASRMLDELDQEAIANQSHSLWLDVQAENVPAVELYKKSGFTEIYQRKGYYQNPPGDAVLMKKNLHEVAASRSDEY